MTLCYIFPIFIFPLYAIFPILHTKTCNLSLGGGGGYFYQVTNTYLNMHEIVLPICSKFRFWSMNTIVFGIKTKD